MNVTKKSAESFKNDLISGLITALFGIPTGMAYAKLAGLNPVYGLYAGIVPVIISSLSSQTALMISTATTAIAVSTQSVLSLVNLEAKILPEALVTLTFLVGIIMLLLGVFRMGRMIDFVSNAVMTGFVVGACTLIIIGELGDLVGIEITAHLPLLKLLEWVRRISEWRIPVLILGLATAFIMLIIHQYKKYRPLAPLIALIAATAIVYFLSAYQVPVVRDIAHIPENFPYPTMPNWNLMPSLLLGALSLAIVGLVQGAGVGTIAPHSGKTSSYSRDFIGQGCGNILGSFFYSMPTGGSISRTGVLIESGAQTRLSGVFSGIAIALIVILMGKTLERIPLSAISGMLILISLFLIRHRWLDVKLMWNTSLSSSCVMGVTFFSCLIIPLQWTIFLGALLSFIAYIYTSATHIRFYQLKRNEEGYFEEQPIPERFPSHEVTILEYDGNGFFGVVPTIRHLVPSLEGVHHAVIIWRMRGLEDVHSSFLLWLKAFAEDLHRQKSLLIVEGVPEQVMRHLKIAGLQRVIGEQHIFPAEKSIGKGLEKALSYAKKWITERT
ncbi:MAG: SulP family inorganic anion transporter [Chlamydiales bacterium]